MNRKYLLAHLFRFGKLCTAIWLLFFLTSCGGAGGGGSSSSSSQSSIASSVSSASSATSHISSASSSQSSENKLRLRISGDNIIGPNGAPVLLRGWNWGRWGLAQPEDAADNAQQGANVVRIPLRWWGFYSGTNIDSRDDAQVATSGIDEKHLAILDTTIAQASAAHLWIILFIDSDCGQNGMQDLDEIAYCDPEGKYPKGHNFWTDFEAREKFINVWKFIAARYKDTPYLGMFEPLPEPNPAGVADTEITQFYDHVMAAIRTQAPEIPFLIGPRSYKITKAVEAFNSRWSDVIYTGNLFVYTSGTQEENLADLPRRLQSLTDLRVSIHVPIFVQQAGVETGEDPQRVYLNALLSLLNNNSVGYSYWEYRDTFNPNAYGVIYQDGVGGWITKTDFLNTIIQYFRE